MRLLICCLLSLTTFPVIAQTSPSNSHAPQTPTFRTLYTFTDNYYDDGDPEGGVILDSQGNLYGGDDSTGFGPSGVIYELSPPASGGSWTFSTLFSLGNPNGWDPISNPVFDSEGNLYGTTWKGGTGFDTCPQGGCGTVFEVSPSGGVWEGATIYEFQGGADGANPTATLVVGADGNLYGTTATGGQDGCCGTVFELSLTSTGWTKTILHSFDGGSRGSPSGGLIFDGKRRPPRGGLWRGLRRGRRQNESGQRRLEIQSHLPVHGTQERLGPLWKW